MSIRHMLSMCVCVSLGVLLGPGSYKTCLLCGGGGEE